MNQLPALWMPAVKCEEHGDPFEGMDEHRTSDALPCPRCATSSIIKRRVGDRRRTFIRMVFMPLSANGGGAVWCMLHPSCIKPPA